MRKTGLHSPAYADWVDYTIYEHGRAIGRIYEERAALPDLRWFWCITIIGARHAGIRTDGRVATLDEAKAQLHDNYRKWLVWAKLEDQD
jgi:hypothetical protein